MHCCSSRTWLLICWLARPAAPQSPASASPSPQSGASVAPWRRVCSFCRSLPPWTWWLWEIDMGSDQPCSSQPFSTFSTSGLLNLSTIALLRILDDSLLCGAVPYIVGCLAGPLDTSSTLYPSRDKPNGLQILPKSSEWEVGNHPSWDPLSSQPALFPIAVLVDLHLHTQKPTRACLDLSTSSHSHRSSDPIINPLSHVPHSCSAQGSMMTCGPETLGLCRSLPPLKNIYIKIDILRLFW